MKKPEILAPAGDLEKLRFAFARKFYTITKNVIPAALET